MQTNHIRAEIIGGSTVLGTINEYTFKAKEELRYTESVLPAFTNLMYGMNNAALLGKVPAQ